MWLAGLGFGEHGPVSCTAVLLSGAFLCLLLLLWVLLLLLVLLPLVGNVGPLQLHASTNGASEASKRSERAKLSDAPSGFPQPIVHALLCCCLVLVSACCCCFGCFCCCWSCCLLLEILLPCSCMLQQLSTMFALPVPCLIRQVFLGGSQGHFFRCFFHSVFCWKHIRIV